MREAGGSDDHYLSVNLEGTECLLEAASQAGVTKFIYCGTIGIFGHRFDGIAHEDSPKAPGNIYEETKLAAESLALDYYERYRLPVVSLRPADVYGPRDQRLLKLFRGVAKGRFPLFGTGRGRRHMVYVDDVVSAFEAAAVSDRAVGKPIIIAGPEICTLYDLIDEIRRQVGRKSFGSQLPLGPVVKVAALTEDLCIQFGITPPLYRRRMDFFTSDAAFDISRAKALLGWEPKVGLREGVRRTLHDYCRAGLIDLPAANPCDTDE
jgi:nucleoside-diphosphate-sugar epimerase